MYKNNFISMGFWLCKCKACKRHKKERRWEYRRIIKKLRRIKNKEEFPHDILDTCKYTD